MSKKRNFQDKDYYLLALLAQLGPNAYVSDRDKTGKITREEAHIKISKLLSCSDKDEISEHLNKIELFTWLHLIDWFSDNYPFEQDDEEILEIQENVLNMLKQLRKDFLSYFEASDIQQKRFIEDMKITVAEMISKHLQTLDKLYAKLTEDVIRSRKKLESKRKTKGRSRKRTNKIKK